MRRLFACARIGAAALGACLIVQAPAGAQTRGYPEKSVRVVVAESPGSASGVLVRLVGQKLSETWGQPVVIDKIVGASGNIGTEQGENVKSGWRQDAWKISRRQAVYVREGAMTIRLRGRESANALLRALEI